MPAGFVIVDPLTLADPVLFLRERIMSMHAADAAPVPPDVLDLRLGAGAGSVALVFDEAAELARAARAAGQRDASRRASCASRWRVATRSSPASRRDGASACDLTRRVSSYAAIPPATSASPS